MSFGPGRFPGVPSTAKEPTEWLRRIASAVNSILQGKINNTGEVTLEAGLASTTVEDPRIDTSSVVVFMPTTANAATEQGKGMKVVCSKGNFVITHTNNAETDRTFSYSFTG